MMIPSALVTFLAPKVVRFVLNSVASMNVPVLEHISETLIDFVNNKYAENKDFIAKAVSDVMPGDQFDGIAVTVVEKLIEIVLREIAKFLENEVTKLKASHADDPVEDEQVFNKIVLKKLASIEPADLINSVSDAAIEALGAMNV